MHGAKPWSVPELHKILPSVDYCASAGFCPAPSRDVGVGVVCHLLVGFVVFF